MTKSLFIDGLRINIEIAGQGEPLLILHGWGSSVESWLTLQNLLAKDFKVFIPDLPGFGQSDAPFKAWTVEYYSNFVLKLVDELKLSSFFLMGHSFGGRISIRFAGKHPEKVKSLILCDASGIKMELDSKRKIVFQMSRLGNFLFSKRLFSGLKRFVKGVFYFFLRHTDYARARGVMRETLKLVVAEDLLPELNNIKVRTLVVWGEKDNMVPVKAAHIFKERIPGSELKIFPGVKHSPHREIPEKLSQVVSNFLKA